MASLKLTVFGSPQVERNGESIVFKTRKALALLVYLVLNPQSHSRETLATLFWPEFSSERAFANLRGALQSLTHMLGDTWFDIRRQEVAMKPDPALRVDVFEFQQIVTRTKEHDHSSGALCESCQTSLKAALDLYREDFLRGFTLPDCPAFDEWQALQTDLLRDQRIACFQQIIADATAQRDLTHALEYARRWVAVCPWSEAAHRELMRTYALNHQRSAALQHYQTCVRMLQEEFGAEPEQETQELYAAILQHSLTAQASDARSENSSGLKPAESHPIERFSVLERSDRSSDGRVKPPPNNLPAQTTSFIGREAEVAEVVHILSQPDVRLLTLSGPGGSGKTRLSLQVATKLSQNYADGVFFVSFAPISDPDLVVSTIVTTLGLHVAGSMSPLEVLNTYLHSKQMLLVLDNFEQILVAAPVLNEVLTAAPGVNIIVTSRTVLRISGEHEYLVPPLTLPDLSQQTSLESLTHSEAVQLFAARATAMQSNFTLTADNTPIVAQICVHLDGLPLAIELAAARINLFSPQALLHRLDSPLRVLSWGVHDLPARQQTLRATIEWSYDLLTPAEQTLFRRLAVFVGGWTLEAAEAVCVVANDPSTGSVQVVDVLNGMQALLDHSLVAEREVNGEPRLTMLETIREYALERLRESDEEEFIRQQHAEFFMELAEEAELQLYSAEQGAWMERLRTEYPNLRAAMAWSIEHEIAIGLRLTGALGQFWNNLAESTEGSDWLTKALTTSQSAELKFQILRAKALKEASLLARYYDVTKAVSLAEESVTLCRTTGDLCGLAHALLELGLALAEQRDHQRAHSLIEESVALFRQTSDRHGLLNAITKYGDILYQNRDYEQAQIIVQEGLRLARTGGNIGFEGDLIGLLGLLAFGQEDFASAQTLWEQGLRVYQKAQNRSGIRWAFHGLGNLANVQGDYEQARRWYEESLATCPGGRGYRSMDWVICHLGHVALQQQHWQEAAAYFAESLPRLQEHGEMQGIAACLAGWAGIAAYYAQPERAARLLGSAARLLETPGHPLFETTVQIEYERIAAVVRSSLGEEAFEAVLAAGRALTLEQAAALALAEI